jgi:hypothetical protein
VSMDWVDRYMTGMDTLWDTDTAICQQSVGFSSMHRTLDGTGGHSGMRQYAGVFIGTQ